MNVKLQLAVLAVAAASVGATPWTATAQPTESKPTYCFYDNGKTSLSSQIFTYDGSKSKVTVVVKWIEFVKSKYGVFFVAPADTGCETENINSLKGSHLAREFEEVEFPIDKLLSGN